jgi:predicted amidophosphoribosyltransferase
MFLSIAPSSSPPPAPRLCSRCGAKLLAHSEKCPGCGKDSSHGTQFLSLIVVTAFLISVPLLVLLVMWLFVTP